MRAGTRHEATAHMRPASAVRPNAPRFRRHRRGHHVLRHRCEQSTVSPTESAARKRAAVNTVAGEGVTQTGAEAPSPKHLVRCRPHVLTRSCTRYKRALTQGTRMLTGSPRGDTSTHYTKHAPQRGEQHETTDENAGAGTAPRAAFRMLRPDLWAEPFAFCGGVPVGHIASVLRIPPNGKQRCGGARSTCSGGQWDREVPPSRVSIRAFITNLVPQRE